MILIGAGLSACPSAHFINGGSSSSNQSTGPSFSTAGLQWLTLNPANAQQNTMVDSAHRQITTTGIPSGGVFSFALLENGQPAQNLNCQNFPGLGETFNGEIHVEPGIQPSGATWDLNCQTTQGPINISLGFAPSTIRIVSATAQATSMFGAGMAGGVGKPFTPDGHYSFWIDGAGQILRRDNQSLTTQYVTLSMDGTSLMNAPAWSFQFTPDGRYVVFTSNASNLISGASLQQTYLKDLQTGAIALVSSTDGSAANDDDSSYQAYVQMSSDGRYVLFQSRATNFVSGATGSQQIYRKDLQTGALDLVSSTDGSAANDDNSSYQNNVQMSSDGRYVLFQSQATNLVSGTTGSEQLYRKDLQTGALVLVSSTDGSAANDDNGGYQNYIQMSADGRYVLFQSPATDFVSGATGTQQIYLKDLQTGTLTLITSTDGSAANDDNGGYQNYVQLSADARYILFESQGTNFFSGATGSEQLYRKDLQTGTITLVSSTDGSAANGDNGGYQSYVQMSADARYVLFQSQATNLISGATGSQQIYRKDLQTGTLTLVSSTDGSAANDDNSTFQNYVQISADGRYVSFQSRATNFVPGSSGSQNYQKDLQTGALAQLNFLQIASVGDNGGVESTLQMSSDGRYVLFQSMANNFVPGKTGWQLYRKDLQAGAIVLVSSADGTPAHEDDGFFHSNALMSSDGRYVVFQSEGIGFISGVSGYQIYRKDLTLQTIDLVSSDASGNEDDSGAQQGNIQITPDGRYVTFSSYASNFDGPLGWQLYRKDLFDGTVVLVSSKDGTPANMDNFGIQNNALVQMSSDGRYVVFMSYASNFDPAVTTNSPQLYRRDLNTGGTIALVSSDSSGATADDSGMVQSNVQITPDGRYVVFVSYATQLITATTGNAQLYRKDLNSGTLTLLSSTDGSAANDDNGGYQNYVQMSSDGRYILFESQATNFVSGTTGSQLYRKDFQTGALSLVSSTDGSAANDDNGGYQNLAQMSSDGRYVLFQSQATNFISGSSVWQQLYRKDLQTGTLALVTSTDGSATNRDNSGNQNGAQITPDGRYVIFISAATNFVPGFSNQQIYLRDLGSNSAPDPVSGGWTDFFPFGH